MDLPFLKRILICSPCCPNYHSAIILFLYFQCEHCSYLLFHFFKVQEYLKFSNMSVMLVWSLSRGSFQRLAALTAGPATGAIIPRGAGCPASSGPPPWCAAKSTRIHLNTIRFCPSAQYPRKTNINLVVFFLFSSHYFYLIISFEYKCTDLSEKNYWRM